METKQEKIYISLPISGYDIEERKDTALKMEIRLRGMGYDVFNPLGQQGESGLTTNEYMERDLRALLDCDGILFMERWNHSAGCHTEFTVAVACGKQIYFEDTYMVKL